MYITNWMNHFSNIVVDVLLATFYSVRGMDISESVLVSQHDYDKSVMDNDFG